MDINTSICISTKAKLENILTSEASALPPGFNKLRFQQETLTVLKGMKDLEKIAGKEIDLVKCLMKGAYLGLSFANKECYVIPYSGTPEFMTDYKGEKKLCYMYSVRPIKNIYAEIVREGDIFEYSIQDNTTLINFKPIAFNRKPIIGSFAVVEYEDKTVNVEMLNLDDLKAIRGKSKTRKPGGVWDEFYGEMCKKAAIRRLTKSVQLDFNSDQLAAWETGSQMNFEKETIGEVKENIKNDISDLDKENENFIDTEFTDTPFEEV